MFLINAHGINPSFSSHKVKLQQIREWVGTSHFKIPFFVITESWLNEGVFDAEISIEGFTIYRADRVERKQGGVVIYISSDIPATDVKIFSSTYCEAVSVYMETANTVLSGVYRPPASYSEPSRRCPVDHFQSCLQGIESFIKKHEPANVVLTGDFNFPMVDWGNLEIKSGLNTLATERQSAELLLSLSERLFLHQVVQIPTRMDKNILDLVLTNNDHLIHDVDVVRTEWSDHDLVKITLKTQEINGILVRSEESRHYVPQSEFDNFNFNKVTPETWQELNIALHQVDWKYVTSAKNQNEAWERFRSFVAKVCSRFVPKHSGSQKRRVQKIPKHRRKLLVKKRALVRKIKRAKKECPVQRKRIEELYTALSRIELNMASNIHEERLKEERKILGKIKMNPKAFYTYANKNKASKSGIGPLKDQKGELHADPAIMANLLQDQYQKVFSEPIEGPVDEQGLPGSPIMSGVTITTDTVVEAIKELSSHTAPGPDKFPAIMLKKCSRSLAPVMAELWQASIQTGDIASIFKQQSIVPIYKKDNKSSPANYRPVSLTSQLIKVLERVIRRQMVNFVEENNLLSPDQHGFRSNRSCLSHLIQHIEDVLDDLENGNNADVLYLDYSKAFDKVCHLTLLQKLSNYGIRGDLLDWIRSFLVGRTQSVIVDGVTSNPGPVRSGVPQGTVLGPLLFVLYINNLPDNVLHSKSKMFADDTKLHKSVSNEDDRERLMDDLQNVFSWALENSMELNDTKFQLLQHGKNSELKQPYRLTSSIVVSGKAEVRDLGVIVDPDLTWRPHITHIIKKANIMASWTLRLFKTRDPQHLLTLYKTYVRSHLEYCCPVWSPHQKGDIQKLEAVQRSYTAKMEGMDNLNYWERLKALKIYSLQRRRERYKILYMWKMSNDLVPKSPSIEFRKTSRRSGVIAERRLGKSTCSKGVKTLIHNSFASSAVGLFNAIPAKVKDQLTIEGAKAELDRFLANIPDTPPTRNYSPSNDNSILKWLETRRGQQSVSLT